MFAGTFKSYFNSSINSAFFILEYPVKPRSLAISFNSVTVKLDKSFSGCGVSTGSVSSGVTTSSSGWISSLVSSDSDCESTNASIFFF